MYRKILGKISSGLYKAHRITSRLAAESLVEPYKLNYQPSDSNVKIVHVNGNFIIGGNTQLIVDIVERMSDKYSHEIIVPSHPRPLPYQPVTIKEFPISEMTSLFEYLKEKRPSLVNINYWIRYDVRFSERALWFECVFKICEELNLKVIQNITVPAFPYKSPAVVHNVFVSRFVAENFNNSPELPMSVIYPGSDFSHFKNDDAGSIPQNTIGMVYRLDEDKLNVESIEVFIAAVKKKPDILCYIVGGGLFFDYYRQRVKEEGFAENFIFTGFVSYKDLPRYYKKIGLFVAPVYDESFGQVTPFAMSMGLAVAGYDVGALGEILGSKETLVEHGKTEKLADLIVELVNNPERKTGIGIKNQKRAHDLFSVEKMIYEYNKLYESILSDYT